MNFIPAERFLELSEEIQKVFLDWWRPSLGNLYCTRNNYDVIDVIINVIKNRVYGLEKDFLGYSNPIGFNLIPLLQMHQLMAFIEDKTKCKFDMDYEFNKGYQIFIFNSSFPCYEFIGLGNNRLEALFQVAIKIAEEEVNHE